MNAQIAQHLNVSESAILEIQEWARVLWVRVRGIGARFVSKRIVKMSGWQQIKLECEQTCEELYPVMSFKKKPTLEAFQQYVWSVVEEVGTGTGSYGSPIVSAERQAIMLPHEKLKAFCYRVEAYRKACDKRDATTKALDSMYGRNGWDQRDREDYEG